MPPEEPPWWYGSDGAWQTRVLRPLSRLYGGLVVRRYVRAKGYRARLPVICVGNLTVGGTGKTPLSLAIAESLLAQGLHPVFLTRGYRGRLTGPVWVDLRTHIARDVGDEPLLLARVAPTVVARDRKAGAEFVERTGRPASVLIMDDGLQNPALVKDLSLAVLDGRRGVGNGEVMPAGPLRAPIEFQLTHVDAIVLNGGEGGDFGARVRSQFPGPVLSAKVAPSEDTSWTKGARVVAFAGIGNPERFFSTLEQLGAEVAARVSFPDHHTFSEENAKHLMALAQEHKAALVTTEKDLARLHGARGALAELRCRSRALTVRMELPEPDRVRLSALIDAAMKGRWRG